MTCFKQVHNQKKLIFSFKFLFSLVKLYHFNSSLNSSISMRIEQKNSKSKRILCNLIYISIKVKITNVNALHPYGEDYF